jgi:hypothetical protein
VLVDLIGRLVRGVLEGAGRYRAAASQADGALRQDLEALARGKDAQAADLGALARGLGVRAEPVAAELSRSSPPRWGVILGEAFQAERALERLGNELGALAREPTLQALAGRMVAAAARQGGEVRKLYLRYT